MGLTARVLPRYPKRITVSGGLTKTEVNGTVALGFDYAASEIGTELTAAVASATSSASSAISSAADAELAKTEAEAARDLAIAAASLSNCEDDGTSDSGSGLLCLRRVDLVAMTTPADGDRFHFIAPFTGITTCKIAGVTKDIRNAEGTTILTRDATYRFADITKGMPCSIRFTSKDPYGSTTGYYQLETPSSMPPPHTQNYTIGGESGGATLTSIGKHWVYDPNCDAWVCHEGIVPEAIITDGTYWVNGSVGTPTNGNIYFVYQYIPTGSSATGVSRIKYFLEGRHWTGTASKKYVNPRATNFMVYKTEDGKIGTLAAMILMNGSSVANQFNRDDAISHTLLPGCYTTSNPFSTHIRQRLEVTGATQTKTFSNTGSYAEIGGSDLRTRFVMWEWSPDFDGYFYGSVSSGSAAATVNVFATIAPLYSFLGTDPAPPPFTTEPVEQVCTTIGQKYGFSFHAHHSFLDGAYEVTLDGKTTAGTATINIRQEGVIVT